MKKFLFVLALLLTINTVEAKPIDISYNDGIYHIILSGQKIMKKISFVVADSLISNREAHIKGRSVLTINAGFFDPKNGKTISYVVTDRTTSADPMFNENLLYNPAYSKNLQTILNRTEFRVIQCGNKFHYDITPHKSEVDFECDVVTSAQGGPLILPQLRLEEEFFIKKDAEGNIIRESASVLHKVARTIIGIKDGNAHILIITDKHPMDLYEVQQLCKQLGFEKAMAFDGGSSTSMNYKKEIEVISTVGDGGGRALKSFMIIKK